MKKITTLNNGVEIPYLGLGTFLAHGDECAHAVEFALRHGYDLIDTAQGYRNESQVGSGWKASGRPREDIFITTKISYGNRGYDEALQSFATSLDDLQTEYVDLVLIHWPDIQEFDRTIDTWRALVELQEQGKSRSIGVSNFTIPLIERLLETTDVVPAVNQVEFHTFLYQQDLLAYCRDKGIQIEAYSPVAKARFFDHEDLRKVAQKHDKTPAQVMLAWLVNHNLVAIPKTVHESRILENADIFFELDDEDMQILDHIEPQTRLVKELGVFDD